ncbi:hypothetical protein GK047_21195 [Paenibacillus sp. SYP-B3998]|uniref:UDP-N-acetylglucosamine 2-epimerase domain-containing protein n=1 Tax=Paenibacillus sp. SYP-B3998 TaxID=2678564 RepID=A0A6G4A2J9_9BACL|nr:hypothetical protein [Paenibacillus sp. SYP-B3998]NEW08518.1 hypothetical protein [Paenibacillus sp. SYP-B3998]
MYGENAINDHMLLRYGYVEDLLTAFESFIYKDIKLPLLMIEAWYRFMRETVDEQLQSTEYVSRKRAECHETTMSDYQKGFQKCVNRQGSFGYDPERTMVLICGQFIDTALKVLHDKHVLVMLTNGLDAAAIRGKEMPETFVLFDFTAEFLRIRRDKASLREEWLPRIEEIIVKHKEHPLFARNLFKGWMLNQVIESISLLDTADMLLHQYPIGIILDHSELIYPGNALSLLASTYNLPFLYVQNNLVSDVNIIPSWASYYCVWGRYTEDWLIQKGVDPYQVRSIGNLRFEHDEKKARKTKQELLDELKIGEKMSILALTTQPYSESTNGIIMEWLREAIADLSVVLVIQPHRDDFVSYDKWLDTRICSMPLGFTLQDLLAVSDFVATISSTTALEAAFYGKPLLVLQPPIPYHFNLNHNDYHKHLAQAEAGLIVRSSLELRGGLLKLLHNEKERAEILYRGSHFLHSSMVVDELLPSQRLYRLVKEIMSRKWLEGNEEV